MRERQLPGLSFRLAALAVAFAGAALYLARLRAEDVESDLRLQLAGEELVNALNKRELEYLWWELDGPDGEDCPHTCNGQRCQLTYDHSGNHDSSPGDPTRGISWSRELDQAVAP